MRCTFIIMHHALHSSTAKGFPCTASNKKGGPQGATLPSCEGMGKSHGESRHTARTEDKQNNLNLRNPCMIIR
ncbi:hypothetical protein LENED_001797 [Lentinula edodes]|uniref:Uncharacterized protein n=1 Tax=Lentinula edodes TaxID=5353 RepID=A0A1Q3DZD0_LENED|nr:hypothetical protein LENED_001797 [Lentinula edodes]